MIRGWCPSVHKPMPSGDGLLARIKPFGGRLPSAALRAFAEAAASYGNGIIELTGRGNLQVRGLTNAPAFARAMVAAGLADPDPAREARRNVIIVPPYDDALVAETESVMSETDGLGAKFSVAVIGNHIHVAGTVVNDAGALRRVLATHPQPSPFLLPLPPAGEGGGEGHLLHLPFGQTDAATLLTLAGLAPDIRTTTWRAFLSPVAAPGFDTAPTDIAACAGAPACASATVPARADATRLAGLGFAKLHLSGCAKGCAYPRATTTLVGRDGRYDLIRHGRAGDAPDHRGLTLDQAIAIL